MATRTCVNEYNHSELTALFNELTKLRDAAGDEAEICSAGAGIIGLLGLAAPELSIPVLTVSALLSLGKDYYTELKNRAVVCSAKVDNYRTSLGGGSYIAVRLQNEVEIKTVAKKNYLAFKNTKIIGIQNKNRVWLDAPQ